MAKRQVNISRAKEEPGGKCYYGFPDSYLEDLDLTEGTWPELSGRGAEVAMEEVPFALEEAEVRPHIKWYDSVDKVLAFLGDPVEARVLSGTEIEAYIYSKTIAVIFKNGEVLNLSLMDNPEDAESKAWQFAFVRGEEK